MIDLSLDEAQLYRLLAGFFGRDRIVPNMSVLAVCGGQVPVVRQDPAETPLPSDLSHWAKGNRCLFTIIDEDDAPKLVLDFAALDHDTEGGGSGGRGTIDAKRLEYQRIARPLLEAAGVKFLTITNDEFSAILDPSGNIDLFSFFRDRFEELGFKIGPDSE